MRVKWLQAARANLIAVSDYITQDNPDAAVRTVIAIVKAVENLGDFPSLGWPGRISGTRELVVSGTPYIVPYRVRDDTIELLLVFHAARKWPSKF